MQLHPLPFSGRPILAFIFWVAFASWVLPEIMASRTKRSTDSSTSRDRGSLYLIAALWCVGIAMDFSLAWLVPQAGIHRNRTALFFVGISLMILGIVFRWYCVSVLGKYFTFDVAIHTGHTLVEVGPYRYVRHPSYTGALLTLVGFGLSLGNWAGLAMVISCMGLAYAYRIPTEEAALASALGESYTQYRKRTWYLVPFLF